MVRLLDFLGIVNGVFLLGSDGTVYPTWIKRNPFGIKTAHVYPFTKIGRVDLLADGEIDPSSPSSYIKKWMFM